MVYGAVVVLLGMLIFCHELGHFLAARLSGLPVARLSLGLGPVVWRRRRGGTEYCLSAIPFGGYVLLGLADPADYLDLPLPARLFFSVSGPLANLLVALACYAALGVLAGGLTWTTVVAGPVAATWKTVQAVAVAIPDLFRHADQVSSLVGIVAEGGRFVGHSAVRYGFLAAYLSVSLAVFNLLPLPPLDGGKMAFDLLHRLHGSLARLYVPSALCGWLVLVGLMLYATAQDLWKYVL